MRKVVIRPATKNELKTIYSLVTSNKEWTRYNGPYFSYTPPSLEEFKSTTFASLLVGRDAQVIVYENHVVGTVSCYWECKETRWLEAGIVIYDALFWGKGIALEAIPLWVSHLFKQNTIERVGLTTWSGNPRMMAVAEKLGFQQEARLRKVRYHEGCYYDSVKYGLLRSEWEQNSLPK